MEAKLDVEEYSSLNKYLEAEIFLVDDEQLVVDTLTYFLQSAGFEKVRGFSDSREAIAQMRYVRPDVIFTDIRMPGLDGNALAKTVRSFPHMYTVPIIAITADHCRETSRSMIKDGAESVLIKPVARETLVQRTVYAIDKEAGSVADLKPGPDVEYFADADHSQRTLLSLFVREESALDRRQRRQNSFRE